MIDPNYISGYIDGEGSFLVSFSLRERFSLGIEVRPGFCVSQRKDRNQVLLLIKSYFGCGSIRFNTSDRTEKKLQSLSALKKAVGIF